MPTRAVPSSTAIPPAAAIQAVRLLLRGGAAPRRARHRSVGGRHGGSARRPPPGRAELRHRSRRAGTRSETSAWPCGARRPGDGAASRAGAPGRQANPADPAPRRAAEGRRPPPTLGDLDARADAISRALKPMERSGRRFREWLDCISGLRVSEAGDPDHRFGFRYDERDGTGLDRRPALVRDRHRRPDFLFLRFSRRPGCESTTTVPGGTADPARAVVRARAPGGGSPTLGDLERRLERLEERADHVEQWSERFDEWESCLSWVPVTEYGDPEEMYGFAFGGEEGDLGYRPASGGGHQRVGRSRLRVPRLHRPRPAVRAQGVRT